MSASTSWVSPSAGADTADAPSSTEVGSSFPSVWAYCQLIYTAILSASTSAERMICFLPITIFIIKALLFFQ